jgi:ABC-type uncharacterized transport system substrate-binding protein
MVATGVAGCSTFEPPREPRSPTEAEVLPEIPSEAPPVEAKVAPEVAPVRTRVAILLTGEVQSYQAIADEIVARGEMYDYAIFSVVNGAMTAADVQAMSEFNPDKLVAIGLAAAKEGEKLDALPMVFCQVFNYQEHALLSARSAGVQLLPPFDLQLQAWLKISPHIQTVGVITGPDQQELIGEITQAANSEGIELLIKRVYSDKELLNAFKRLTPQIQGFWLLPDNRLLSPSVLREIFPYARKHDVQIAVFNSQLLDFGADISFTSQKANVADTVLKVLGAAGSNVAEGAPTMKPLSRLNVRLSQRMEARIEKQAAARPEAR